MYDDNCQTYCADQSASGSSCIDFYQNATTLPFEEIFRFDCSEEQELDIFSMFPWLDDPADCESGDRIGIYKKYGQMWVVHSNDQGMTPTSIYDEDGTLYCTDIPSANCLDYWELTSEDLITEWACDGAPRPVGQSTNDILARVDALIAKANHTDDGANVELHCSGKGEKGDISGDNKTDDIVIDNETQEAPSKVVVYPNPSNGLFNIIGIADATVIKVLNANGQLIKTGLVKEGAIYRLDLSLESSGLYLLSITTDENTEIKLLVKQ